MVVIDVVVDVAGSLEDQVAVETARNMIFFKKSCTPIADIDPIAKGSRHFVEKNMRMGVTIYLYAYFLIQSH